MTIHPRKLIFISGPVTSDPYGCVPKAVKKFDELWDQGWAPILPQLSIFHNMFSERSYEDWMEYFDTIIVQCSALYRMLGESSGADREVARAHRLGIPIYWQTYEDNSG